MEWMIEMKVILRHGYISIPDYTLGDNLRFENMLSVYDDVYHKKDPLGYYYEEETRELRVPAGIGINMVAKMLNREADVDFVSDEPRKAIFNLKTEPRSVSQKNFISFLSGEGAFTCNAKYSQICVVAGTGEGKTYCAIAALSFLRMTTIVISNTVKLRLHWKQKVMSYTGVTDDDCLLLDSSAKMERLMKQTKPIRYKFFSATHDTIDSYAKKHSWNAVGEFFKKMGIGVTIIDEVHKCFGNTVRVLTHTNSKKYFVLTATFKRSEFRQNKIFQICFSSIPKYIQKEREGGESSQKHITGVMVIYNSKPSMATEMSVNGPKGLDKFKYANYLINYDPEFFKLLGLYLTHFALNGGMKTFVFCGSIDACSSVANFAANMFPNLKVGIYNSGVKLKQAEKEKILEDCDIIATTSGSLGEGADVDGLHAIINTEAYRNEIAAVQNPGRLRDLNDGKKYYYVELINKGFKKVFDQFKSRKKIFEENMGDIKTVDYTKKR